METLSLADRIEALTLIVRCGPTTQEQRAALREITQLARELESRDPPPRRPIAEPWELPRERERARFAESVLS